MAIFYLPRIAPENYEAIRRILDPHLPDTYDEWLYLAAKESADYDSRGHRVEVIEIQPHEFSAYADSLRPRHDLKLLWDFAFEKARRK